MVLNIDEIKKFLLHRYPFLLIDKIIDLEPGKSCTAIKNLTYNELFFQGHFENYPVVPGVLLIESIAQASGFIFFEEDKEKKYNTMLLTGLNKCKFKKQGRPGDQLIIKTKLVAQRSFIRVFDGEIFIKDTENNETLCCTATINLALTNT